jgi:hypothetical protein
MLLFKSNYMSDVNIREGDSFSLAIGPRGTLLLPLTDALRKLIPASIEVTDDMTNGKRLFKRLPPLVLLEGLLALA